jgi:hypothetical protein
MYKTACIMSATDVRFKTKSAIRLQIRFELDSIRIHENHFDPRAGSRLQTAGDKTF